MDGIRNSNNKDIVYQFLLFLLSFTLISYKIGDIPLFESSEGRYASVARAIIDDQNWFIPHFNGLIHITKPPLAYWISALGQTLFGVNEFGAKAFLPLFASCSIIGCYNIAKTLFSVKIALLSSYILITSILFNIQFRGLTTDPFLVTFEIWMIWALFSYLSKPSRFYIILFYIFLSLGFLTKGPPVFLPLFGIIVALMIAKKLEPLKILAKDYAGWIIFGIIGLGWYLFIILKIPKALSYFIVNEVFNRVATNFHNREGPWYYHIVVTLGGMFPWTIFCLFAILWLTKKILLKKHNEKEILLVLWYILPLILLSLARSKLAPYSLPLIIPCSLLTAYYLAPILSFKKEEPFEFKLEVSVTLFILGILCICLLYLSFEGYFVSKNVEKLIVLSAIILISITGFGYMFLNFEIAKGVILILGFVVPTLIIILLGGIKGDEEIIKGKFLPSYARFIKEINQNYSNANIISLYDQLHSFYFYTGKVIPIWRYKYKKAGIPILGNLIHPDEEDYLKEFAKNENSYVLSQISKAKSIEPIIQKKLKLVKSHQKWGLFLITNDLFISNNLN